MDKPNMILTDRQTYIPSFSGIRVFLAFAIFVTHWYTSIAADLITNNFMSSFGSFAVVFFFVISGYLICNKYNDSFDSLNFGKIKDFAVKHVKKLYFPYVISSIPALIVYLVYIYGEFLSNGSFFEIGKSVFRIILNAFLVQSILPFDTTISINFAAWFLSCLTILYAVTPFLIRFKNKFLCSPIKIIISLIVCIIMSTVLLRYDCLYITPYYRVFQFFSGMIIFDIVKILKQRNFKLKNATLWEFVVIIFSLCACFKTFIDNEILFYFLSALSACMFTFVFSISLNGLVSRFLSHNFIIYLSNYSMEVYLFHFPIIQFAASFKEYLPKNLIFYIILGVALLIITFMFSILFKKIVVIINKRKCKA